MTATPLDDLHRHLRGREALLWTLEGVGERDARRPTPHRVPVHVVAETHRHAGHADLVRELVDGGAGLRVDATDVPEHDEAWRAAHRPRPEQAATDADGR